jgi:hypothetical protein
MFQAGKNCVQTATRIESTFEESDARHPDTGRDPLNAGASFSAAQRIQTSDRENHFLLLSLKSRCMIQAAERETEGEILITSGRQRRQRQRQGTRTRARARYCGDKTAHGRREDGAGENMHGRHARRESRTNTHARRGPLTSS